MSFPDHPLTIAINVLDEGKPIRNPKDALAVIDAMRTYRRSCSMCNDQRLNRAYERLEDYLSSTNKVHSVQCRHEQLKRFGKTYRCAECDVVVLKRGD